jgi:hypothetical protein
VPGLLDEERSPADFFPLPARAVRVEDRRQPGIEMHARPGQHGQRYAQILMLAKGAL